ncbi:MAG: hypothetical protein EOO71_24070 [Myxococcaceae bacterium]|nr:MAG: hypothetical protein EOO71_24070 [Myxococcaceae bacterium]
MKSSGPGGRPYCRAQPSACQSARMRARTGWMGISRTTPVFVAGFRTFFFESQQVSMTIFPRGVMSGR